MVSPTPRSDPLPITPAPDRDADEARRRVKRHPMTNWYDPGRLVSIGIRVAISTVFGEFADRREAVAASRPLEPDEIEPCYDYSKEGAGGRFWFDFVADTGDGWNPTYAIARLLSAPELKNAEVGPLKRGRFLIMGGDQVYPTASRDAYAEKLVAPYDQAVADNRISKDVLIGDLYAIPGNHDWYDGLLAFLGLFCSRRIESCWNRAKNGRWIGNRRTQQTRSYFALALPHNWWLWGVDIQLEGYIDQPQIDFFDHVARKWMPADGARLIICSGQPEWANVDVETGDTTLFKNFSYLERVAYLANPKHQLRLVLSGDSHHYAHFQEDQRHYLTAGGGGAFLHPTHQLSDKCFRWDYPPPGISKEEGKTYQRSFMLKKTVPAPQTSRRLAWGNLAFAFLNPKYTGVLGVACGFFAWLLNANAIGTGTSLQKELADAGTFSEALWNYLLLVFQSPWPLALVAVAIGGYYKFAGFQPAALRLAVGLLHAALQLSVVVVATILLARTFAWTAIPWAFIAAIGICGGVLAATVMGLYLLFCLNVLRKHFNEAFSALRIQGYKNFLRLCIETDGSLSVHAIGLKRVPKTRRRLEPSPLESFAWTRIDEVHLRASDPQS